MKPLELLVGTSIAASLLLAGCASPGDATSNTATPVASAPAANETSTPTASETPTPPAVEAVDLNTPRIKIKESLIQDFYEKLQTSIDGNIPQTLVLAGEVRNYADGALTITSKKQVTVSGTTADNSATFSATQTRGDKMHKGIKDRYGDPVPKTTQVMTMNYDATESDHTTITVISSWTDSYLSPWGDKLESLQQVAANAKAWKPARTNELGVKKQADPPVFLNTMSIMDYRPTYRNSIEFPTYVLINKNDPDGHRNTIGFKVTRGDESPELLVNLSPREILTIAKQYKIDAPLESQESYPADVEELYGVLHVELPEGKPVQQ
ncbi:MAG TPA: hypothetical protein PKC31_00840 [Candidatus Nanoperiomorbaceae bacterium]|nr:hypothetical protein [Candidatus Nanoperiomorbaceae bacterium]